MLIVRDVELGEADLIRAWVVTRQGLLIVWSSHECSILGAHTLRKQNAPGPIARTRGVVSVTNCADVYSVTASTFATKRAVRHVVFDTNYWKSFVQARLVVAQGDPGCLSLFGTSPVAHRLFAEHLAAEYRVKTEGRGRTVDEWKIRPEQPDNHWLDGIVGCAVAASIQGCILFGTDERTERAREKVRLSVLQRSRRA